jgi:hypothetical protein
MHVLPAGFHRIRYYGFLNSQSRARNIARIRELLAAPLIPVDAITALDTTPEQPKAPEQPCPCCGSPMRIIETFLRGQQPQAPRIASAARNQDRYLMTPAPLTNTHNDRHRRSWLSAGSAACLSARIWCAMTDKKHFAVPQNVPLVRPHPNPDASVLERLKALYTLRVTYPPEPAAKSP